MNKGGILGEVLEQAGGLVKQAGRQVVKTPFEVSKGVAEQVGLKPQIPTSAEADLNKLRTKEEKEKAKNLALTRQRLTELMASSRKPEPRPAERVEIEKQKEIRVIQEEQAKKPPPLPIQKGKGTKERLPGISG